MWGEMWGLLWAIADGASAAPPPVDDLVGGDIFHVPARCTLAVVEARTTTVAVPARQTMIEVTRGR